MMEAVITSETSVNFNATTRRNIPEDSELHTRRLENLKSFIFHIVKISFVLQISERIFVPFFFVEFHLLMQKERIKKYVSRYQII
jgi:hypothetical protein